MEQDAIIRDNVIDELDFDPRLDAAGIGVAVKDAVVTLFGHVPNYAQRLDAERAALRVKGVRAVAMDIEVRLPLKDDDQDIAERAANVLAWSAVIGEEVKAAVDDGWVTLSGIVPWRYQREEAERAVCQLAGVIGVTNQISVRGQVTPSDVRDRIAKAFHRNADLESSSISVDVSGSTVTLSGKVKVWHERQVAEDAVWSIPGILEVRDNIVVESAA
jgi:osmotically-inducible protein OsmY